MKKRNCPFCGGPVKKYRVKIYGKMRRWYLTMHYDHCVVPDLTMSRYCYDDNGMLSVVLTKKEMKAWNRRFTDV